MEAELVTDVGQIAPLVQQEDQVEVPHQVLLQQLEQLETLPQSVHLKDNQVVVIQELQILQD